MILGFNLIGFIATILPPFLYALVIYFFSPKSSISFFKIPSFIIGGTLSILFLQILYFLIPYEPSWNMVNPFNFQFFNVAPREEISKLFSFLLCLKVLNWSKKPISPISFMYYFSLIGLGFALIENINYVSQYGIGVIMSRSFGATLVHTICGFIFGYWIGLGKIKSTANNLSHLFLHFPKLKLFIYTFFGFLCSSIFHGTWNYTIQIFQFASTPLLVILIFGGILLCKFFSFDLLNKQNNQKMEKLNSALDSSKYLEE